MGGSVNTTHLIAFQEQDNDAVPVNDIVTTERMKQRRINVDSTKFVNPTINKKKKPPQLPEANLIADNSPDFMIKYFIWLLLRK